MHPRQPPGRRHTDPADLSTEVAAHALRDVESLARRAAAHGPAIGAYAAAVLDHPLPWTKMRQFYRLLGLVRRHGPDRVELACRRALDAEAVANDRRSGDRLCHPGGLGQEGAGQSPVTDPARDQTSAPIHTVREGW